MSVFDVRENAVFSKRIYLRARSTYIEEIGNDICFFIFDDSINKYIKAFCITKDGITSENKLNVCVVNTTPIDVNLASETIGITTLQTIQVDTGLTELGISSFPITNANINISAQSLPNIQIQSNNENIMTESTSTLINRNVNENIGINPFEEKLYSISKSIYKSNYRGLQESDQQLFYEAEASTGAPIILYNNYGVQANLATGETYERITRFFPYRHGKTLYTYTMSNISFSSAFPYEFDYEFGLKERDGNRICFLVHCEGGAGLGSPTISILIEMTNESGSMITQTISQSSFNIDIIDGTGPSSSNKSGYTYFGNWATNKFFILTDENLHYTFGLINGTNLIPCHSFSQNDVKGEFSEGQLFAPHRPYFRAERLDSVVGVRTFTWYGFEIYKDTTLSLINFINSTFSGTIAGIPFLFPVVVTSTAPLFLIRYRATDYYGNVQLGTFHINTNRTCVISIIYGNDESPIVTIGGGAGTNLGNINYDTGPTSYTSGGYVLYQSTILSGVTEFKLDDYFNTWKLFGFDQSVSTRNEILFTIASVSGAAGTADWNMNFNQF